MDKLPPNDAINRALQAEQFVPYGVEPLVVQNADGELGILGANRGKFHRLPEGILPAFDPDGSPVEESGVES